MSWIRITIVIEVIAIAMTIRVVIAAGATNRIRENAVARRVILLSRGVRVVGQCVVDSENTLFDRLLLTRNRRVALFVLRRVEGIRGFLSEELIRIGPIRVEVRSFEQVTLLLLLLQWTILLSRGLHLFLW